MVGDVPLRLEARPLHRSLSRGAVSIEHVLLRISAAKEPSRIGWTPPRLSAVLVLDVSGSMEGNPLAQVKDTVARLSTILGDEDALGVVVFSTGARTVTPIRRLADKTAQQTLQRSIHSLIAAGYTNISSGLSHAAMLFSPRAEGERQLILLLSDGQPNVGTQSSAGLSAEVALIKSRGIALSTLGFGAQHNEDLLLALADTGGGRYAFVKDPLLAGPTFARALGAQRDVIAENVQLVIAPKSGVEILRVLGEARTSYGEGGLRVQLADLMLGEVINVVVEVKVEAPRELGRVSLLRATLSGQSASITSASITSASITSASIRSASIRSVSPQGAGAFSLQEEATVDVLPEGSYPPELEVQELAVMANADALRQRARSFADQRNFVAAADCLRQAQASIVEVHGGVPPDGSALRDVYETILDDLQVAERAPPPAEYSILRKAQLDQQTFITGINRAAPNLTPSAQHMVLKLASTHGVVARARLVCIDGADRGRAFELPAECRIGRGGDNQVILAEPGATRRHALIQWIGRGFVAHDLGSSNGTFVNGQHIVDDRLLKNGDVIAIGQTRLRFEWLDKKDP